MPQVFMLQSLFRVFNMSVAEILICSEFFNIGLLTEASSVNHEEPKRLVCMSPLVCPLALRVTVKFPGNEITLSRKYENIGRL